MTEVSSPELSRLRRARIAVGKAGRQAYRYARRFAVTIGVIVAVIVVSTLTLDLGPALKARAETEGSKWLDRQLTIGRLGVHLGSGKFVIEDLAIGGMFPNEPPWLVAKRIDVSLNWSALLHREVLLDAIEMTDWTMTVESFPDGRQTFPRLTGPPRAPRTSTFWRSTSSSTTWRRALAPDRRPRISPSLSLPSIRRTSRKRATITRTSGRQRRLSPRCSPGYRRAAARRHNTSSAG